MEDSVPFCRLLITRKVEHNILRSISSNPMARNRLPDADITLEIMRILMKENIPLLYFRKVPRPSTHEMSLRVKTGLWGGVYQ